MNIARIDLLFCLLIISPVIPLGFYGIRIVDILIPLIFLFFIINNHLFNKKLLILLSLLFISMFCSILNGYISFGIPIRFQSFISISYRLIYVYTFFTLAKTSSLGLEEIISSKILKLTIILISLIVVTFLFLSSTDQKFLLLKLFWSNSESLKERLTSTPRFPGIGNNINIFSYVQLIVFHFSLNSYLKRNNSNWIICLLTMFNIIVGGSRKAILLLAFSIFTQVLTVFKKELFSQNFRKYLQIKKKSIKLFFIIPAVSLAIILFLSNSSIGSWLIGNTNTNQVSIFSSLTSLSLDVVGSGRSTLGLRLLYMYGGLKRIQLSPLFGIPNSKGNVDNEFLSFVYPHNEFLQIWTLYGIISMLCIVLVLVKSFKLLKYKNQKNIWFLFLIFTFFQASVDTMFLDYQSLGIFLICLGNLFAKKEL